MKNDTNFYDMALGAWKYLETIPGTAYSVFVNAQNEVKLGKYLINPTQMGAYANGEWALCRDDSYSQVEVLGRIVDVRLGSISYWVVTKDGEIDIFVGKIEHKPVRLHP